MALNNETQSVENNGKTALIIGGSIAGLLTAHVLSDYYEHIVIIERDNLPEEPVIRAGTPQAFHIHRLVPTGAIILERLLPGLTDDLIAHGAHASEGSKINLLSKHGEMHLDYRGKGATWTRALFEYVIRLRVKKLANVRFMLKQEVIGLLHSAEENRIMGVTIRERGQMEHQTTLTADMVIDASGRFSKLSHWLESLGYEMPVADRVKGDMGYSTAYLKVPEGFTEKWGTIDIEADPSRNIKEGVIAPVENGGYNAILYGAAGDYPETDEKGFLDGFSHLVNPLLAEVLKDVEISIQPRGFRIPECVRNHYEKMENWPAGLLVTGDSFAHYSPVHGQGMTIVMMEAEILAASFLDQKTNPHPDFERRVLDRMQDAIESAWWLSTVSDTMWKGVEYVGEHSEKGYAFAQKYLEIFYELAVKNVTEKNDFGLYIQYLSMRGLLCSPRELLNAQMVNTIVELKGTEEARQMVADLREGSDQSLEEILDQVIPAFKFPFQRKYAVSEQE